MNLSLGRVTSRVWTATSHQLSSSSAGLYTGLFCHFSLQATSCHLCPPCIFQQRGPVRNCWNLKTYQSTNENRQFIYLSNWLCTFDDAGNHPEYAVAVARFLLEWEEIESIAIGMPDSFDYWSWGSISPFAICLSSRPLATNPTCLAQDLDRPKYLLLL